MSQALIREFAPGAPARLADWPRPRLKARRGRCGLCDLRGPRGRMLIVRLAYERIGSGEPLVLLHGIGHRRQAWGAVLDWLAPHRQLILVDLPGHGDSP